MTPNESLAIRLANEVGATQYSTPPMRAVTGRSFTWEQLEKFVELVASAEAAKWAGGSKLSIPTDSMEQEFQSRYRQGYADGVAHERDECALIANAQRHNTSVLLSSPVLSSAAYEIVKAIRSRV